jgi:hypothetical protein
MWPPEPSGEKSHGHPETQATRTLTTTGYGSIFAGLAGRRRSA